MWRGRVSISRQRRIFDPSLLTTSRPPPRSYFESLPPRRICDSTSGPGPTNRAHAKVSSRERGCREGDQPVAPAGMEGRRVGMRNVSGQVLDSSRSLGMTGGYGWGPWDDGGEGAGRGGGCDG